MPPFADRAAALLRGEPVAWNAMGPASSHLLAWFADQGLTGLIHQRVRMLPPECAWPEEVMRDLARDAHACTAAEILRAQEIRGVLHDFEAAGIRPILLKGTPLAYSVYAEPGQRPRGDTDMLVRDADVETARRVLAARGYHATLHCDDLFSQFEVQKRDALGVVHAFDVHWKISTQPTFEHLLTYAELARDAVAVPALGPHARTGGPVHVLLLSCVHPVMHHQNVEHLLWTYDTHLLASRLSADEVDEFVKTARRKAMTEVCLRQLQRAHEAFGTDVSAFAWQEEGREYRREPSAEYLRGRRRWHHELASILSALPGWSMRARHLRGVLFPSPQYVLGAYGLEETSLGRLLLPALYLHRNVNGAWKILSGRK